MPPSVNVGQVPLTAGSLVGIALLPVGPDALDCEEAIELEPTAVDETPQPVETLALDDQPADTLALEDALHDDRVKLPIPDPNPNPDPSAMLDPVR